MMTFYCGRPEQCGLAELDSRGVVTNFYDKVNSPFSSITDAAAYILSVDMIRKNTVVPYLGNVYPCWDFRGLLSNF